MQRLCDFLLGFVGGAIVTAGGGALVALAIDRWPGPWHWIGVTLAIGVMLTCGECSRVDGRTLVITGQGRYRRRWPRSPRSLRPRNPRNQNPRNS